jgi:hypothetical protein
MAGQALDLAVAGCEADDAVWAVMSTQVQASVNREELLKGWRQATLQNMKAQEVNEAPWAPRAAAVLPGSVRLKAQGFGPKAKLLQPTLFGSLTRWRSNSMGPCSGLPKHIHTRTVVTVATKRRPVFRKYQMAMNPHASPLLERRQVIGVFLAFAFAYFLSTLIARHHGHFVASFDAGVGVVCPGLGFVGRGLFPGLFSDPIAIG